MRIQSRDGRIYEVSDGTRVRIDAEAVEKRRLKGLGLRARQRRKAMKASRVRLVQG